MVGLQPSAQYSEVTVRLWGKGVVLRRRVAGAEIAGTKRFVAKAGQFILSRIDARNGAIGVVPADLDGAIVTNDFPVFDTETTRLDTSYLGWLTKTADFIELCKRASEGTTNRVRLQEDRFLGFEIPLPRLAEQRCIVAWIEELAKKIGEAHGLRETTLKGTTALIVASHVHLSGARKRRLGDILELEEMVVPVVPTAIYPQVGVKSFGGGLFAKASLGGSDTTYKSFNRLYEGALVLSQVKGWEGAVAICPEELHGWYVSPEYRTFRCKPSEVHPKYLRSLVGTEWFWSRLSAATRGVGARRERTRPEQFLQLELPMPRVEQQEQKIVVFKRIDAVNRLAAQTSPAQEALLPSILHRAFRGEL